MRDAITQALKDAMKGQDKLRLGTLRLVNAAIKDRDIAGRAKGKDEVCDAEILEILAKMIKQRADSIEQYTAAGRMELADQEKRESEIIAEFLPAQMDEDSMKSACRQAVDETGAESLRDMGKCMSALKAQYPGQMDFGKASGMVKGILGSSG
ncbi:MAG: GatB/YqeY domain-containing protein [Pseudomonadota bacterium]